MRCHVLWARLVTDSQTARVTVVITVRVYATRSHMPRRTPRITQRHEGHYTVLLTDASSHRSCDMRRMRQWVLDPQHATHTSITWTTMRITAYTHLPHMQSRSRSCRRWLSRVPHFPLLACHPGTQCQQPTCTTRQPGNERVPTPTCAFTLHDVWNRWVLELERNLESGRRRASEAGSALE